MVVVVQRMLLQGATRMNYLGGLFTIYPAPINCIADHSTTAYILPRNKADVIELPVHLESVHSNHLPSLTRALLIEQAETRN